MKRINIAAPEFEFDPEDPQGFRSGIARLSKSLGSEDSGISLYELPPGQAICPYHYEAGEVAIWTGDEETDLIVRRESGVEYFDGEDGSGW